VIGGGVNRAISWLPGVLARLRFNRTLGRHQGILHSTDAGLELRRYHFRDGGPVLEAEWTFDWSDVSSIVGYKIDALTTDQIRLAFEIRGETIDVVTEDMTGFKALTERMRSPFDGISESWWSQVAYPAFETNWTTIWKRSGEV
jgi:hypothetical protein